MSYCRFGYDGSEVYVYSGADGIVCCGCRLDPIEQTTFELHSEMIAHLLEHRKAGHVVPQYAIDTLLEESMAGYGGNEEE